MMEKEYVRNEMGVCAKCGSHNIEFGDTLIDGDELHYYYTCPDCGGAGCETYKLMFECNSVIIDE